MEIIISPVVYIKTDDGNNINLKSIDSIRVLPKEDAGDDKNIIEATIGGNIIQVTDYLGRTEAEAQLGQILVAQQTYTAEVEGGVPSVPPEGFVKVINIFVNPLNGRFRYQIDDGT